MKKVIRLISMGAALAIALVFNSCSTTKKEGSKEIAETTDATAVVEPKPVIKPFQSVDPKIKTHLNEFLAGYFAVNQMLINDNYDGAKKAAANLSEAVKKFDIANLTAEQMDFYYVQVSKVNEGIKGIVESADIGEARLELATLSEGVYTLAKAFHPNESALYYQYCPMARNGKGANWISSTKEIANPYMGQSMPECGRIEETIE